MTYEKHRPLKIIEDIHTKSFKELIMAKPRRRRNNKHNLSTVEGKKANGEIEQIPRSRKAFKWLSRQYETFKTSDHTKIKTALYGIKTGDIKFLSHLELEFNTKAFEGYWSVNAKGDPVRLTDAQLEMYKKIKLIEKENKRKFQEAV